MEARYVEAGSMDRQVQLFSTWDHIGFGDAVGPGVVPALSTWDPTPRLQMTIQPVCTIILAEPLKQLSIEVFGQIRTQLHDRWESGKSLSEYGKKAIVALEV